MIQTCTEVVGRVYDYEGEVDALMDEVERDILRISESRVQSQTTTIKDLVKKAINTIEDFHQRQGVLTGVGTGLHGPGQDDQRAARRRDGGHRGAAEHGQDLAGHEHRRTCRDRAAAAGRACSAWK